MASSISSSPGVQRSKNTEVIHGITECDPWKEHKDHQETAECFLVGIIEWEDPGIPHTGVSLSSQVIKSLAVDLLLGEKDPLLGTVFSHCSLTLLCYQWHSNSPLSHSTLVKLN